MEQPHLWLTYDLKSGKRLSLKDIFADGVDYRSIINRKISEQIWRDGLEETRLKRPFAGIDSNQLFYITPDALVIVFPAQNPYFKYTYDYEVKGNHFFRFFIPFYELPDATIFDKYWTERSIFFRPFTLKQTLPNKLKTIYKQKKIVKDLYEVRVGYYEIQGYKDPAIQEKINQIMLKQAERLLVDERFDHIDKPDGWKKFYKEVIPGLRGNVGGYIGISYFTTGHFPPGWEKREEDEGAWYFDLRTGKEFKLEDLFNSRERCIQVIDREIRENYKYDDFEGFEHYIDKVPFAFDMTRLYITFPYDDPYFKNKSRSIRIPYERFKLDDLKLF